MPVLYLDYYKVNVIDYYQFWFHIGYNILLQAGVGHPIVMKKLTLLEDLQKFNTLFREKLNKIRDKHKGNNPPPPSVHVLGDFNFGDIVWPDRHNKCGSHFG